MRLLSFWPDSAPRFNHRHRRAREADTQTPPRVPLSVNLCDSEILPPVVLWTVRAADMHFHLLILPSARPKASLREPGDRDCFDRGGWNYGVSPNRVPFELNFQRGEKRLPRPKKPPPPIFISSRREARFHTLSRYCLMLKESSRPPTSPEVRGVAAVPFSMAFHSLSRIFLPALPESHMTSPSR